MARAWMLAALALGCSRAPRAAVCELDVRAADGVLLDEAQLACAADALRIRLEAVADPFAPSVRVVDERSLAVGLSREPDDSELDRLRTLVGYVHTFGVALVADDATAGVRREDELARLTLWCQKHVGTPIEDFNQIPREAGGPSPTVVWHVSAEDCYSRPLPVLQRARLCLSAADPSAALLADVSALDLERIVPKRFDRGLLEEGRTHLELVWKAERWQQLDGLLAARRSVILLVDGQGVGTQWTQDAQRRLKGIELTGDERPMLARERALRSAMAAGARPARLEVVGLRPLR